MKSRGWFRGALTVTGEREGRTSALVDGWILDAYPTRPGVVTVWIKPAHGQQRPIAVHEPFHPEFYVRAPRAAHARLRDGLGLMGALRVDETTRRCGLADAPREVLRVVAPGPRELHRLATWAHHEGEAGKFDLYDVDLKPAQRFLQEKGLWPFAKVRTHKPGLYRLLDEGRWSLAYDPPPLSILALDAKPAQRGALPRHDDPIRVAWLGEEEIAGASEEDVLLALQRRVHELDPDVLLTKGGDSWLMAYLDHRARACGLADWTLGREGGRVETRKARSFWGYNRMKYRPPAHLLRGRMHLDTEASFFFKEAGLPGLIDLARITSIPLQEIARLEAGTAITAIQMDLARREGRIVPWLKNQPDAFSKSVRKLMTADRGGYTFDAQVGLYEDVVELDFVSLYPSLMRTRNLSPETIQCACCDPGAPDYPVLRVVPQIGYHVCREREGFVGRSLEPLLARRAHFKKMRKLDPANRERYQAICDVLKWLLVVSFGYTGYRNARFGDIRVHESICAWGREVLLRASEVAEDHGFSWIHGIVDSLWLRRIIPGSSAEGLAEAVGREIGIPFDLQGRYKWIVFLPTATMRDQPGLRDVPALTKYYGCFDGDVAPSRSQMGQKPDHLAGGRLKVRGVELRQHDKPALLRGVQEQALLVLARADNAAEFRALLPEAVETLRPILTRLRAGEVPLQDLVWSTSVSQDVDEYQRNTPVAAALRVLKAHGKRLSPGEVVRYVVTKENAKDPREHVAVLDTMTGAERYDVGFYERHAVRALASLVSPFGWTEERTTEHFAAATQTRLIA